MLHKKYLFGFFTVLWICFIFSFSLRDGEVSSAMSDKVGQVIIENSSPEISERFDDLSIDGWKDFHQAIRKMGHFAEFFILGVLMYLTLRQTHVAHRLLTSFGLCMLVGACDETIQLFIDGRSGQFKDVLLDSCGGLVGIWMIWFLIRFMSKSYQN